MKSEKVVNDMWEYLILFGSRDNPLEFNRMLKDFCWVLNDDLSKKLEAIEK